MMDEKIAEELKHKDEQKKEFLKEKKELLEAIEKSNWIICAVETEEGFSVAHLRFSEEGRDYDMKMVFEVVGFLEYLRQSILDGSLRQKMRENRMRQQAEGIERMLFESLPDEVKKKIKEDSN